MLRRTLGLLLLLAVVTPALAAVTLDQKVYFMSAATDTIAGPLYVEKIAAINDAGAGACSVIIRQGGAAGNIFIDTNALQPHQTMEVPQRRNITDLYVSALTASCRVLVYTEKIGPGPFNR